MRRQHDAVAGDGMFDCGKGADFGETKSRAVCRRKALRPGLPPADFKAGEFPQVRVHDAGGPLANEKPSAALDHESDEASGRCRCAPANLWKFFLPTAVSRDAEVIDGAKLAARQARRADERAEFHEGLVEARTRRCVRPVLRSTAEGGREARCVMNQFLRDSPKLRVGLLFARVSGDAEDASQD